MRVSLQVYVACKRASLCRLLGALQSAGWLSTIFIDFHVRIDGASYPRFCLAGEQERLPGPSSHWAGRISTGKQARRTWRPPAISPRGGPICWLPHLGLRMTAGRQRAN